MILILRKMYRKICFAIPKCKQLNHFSDQIKKKPHQLMLLKHFSHCFIWTMSPFRFTQHNITFRYYINQNFNNITFHSIFVLMLSILYSFNILFGCFPALIYTLELNSFHFICDCVQVWVCWGLSFRGRGGLISFNHYFFMVYS